MYPAELLQFADPPVWYSRWVSTWVLLWTPSGLSNPPFWCLLWWHMCRYCRVHCGSILQGSVVPHRTVCNPHHVQAVVP